MSKSEALDESKIYEHNGDKPGYLTGSAEFRQCALPLDSCQSKVCCAVNCPLRPIKINRAARVFQPRFGARAIQPRFGVRVIQPRLGVDPRSRTCRFPSTIRPVGVSTPPWYPCSSRGRAHAVSRQPYGVLESQPRFGACVRAEDAYMLISFHQTAC